MKLLLAYPRGFCAGVVRAIDTVKKALEIWGPPIYVRHEIVHNRHVVNELKSLGVLFIEDLKEVPAQSRVVFSAHGVPSSVREEAKSLNLKVIDATCCLVTKVHSAAKRFAERGYHIILIGHRNHVEIVGTAGEARQKVSIVETLAEIEQLPSFENQKIAYLTQTTLSVDDVAEMTHALKRKYPHIESMPSSSICYATQNRQTALKEVVRLADVAIVVGDPKSSNSNRLREVAEKRGVRSYLVDCSGALKKDWLAGVHTIAMSAGASTPETIVQECVSQLKEFGVDSVEECAVFDEDVVFQLPKEVSRH